MTPVLQNSIINGAIISTFLEDKHKPETSLRLSSLEFPTLLSKLVGSYQRKVAMWQEIPNITEQEQMKEIAAKTDRTRWCLEKSVASADCTREELYRFRLRQMYTRKAETVAVKTIPVGAAKCAAILQLEPRASIAQPKSAPVKARII